MSLEGQEGLGFWAETIKIFGQGVSKIQNFLKRIISDFLSESQNLVSNHLQFFNIRTTFLAFQ